MSYQNIFKRYEIKYLITREQKEAIKQLMSGNMEADKYGRSTICNIYFDTPNYLLIRRSTDKPMYKEKLRVRSYGTADKESTVFVELKKKAFESIWNGKEANISVLKFPNVTDALIKKYRKKMPVCQAGAETQYEIGSCSTI